MPEVGVYENAQLTAHRLDKGGSVVGALYDAGGDLVPASVRSIGREDRWRTADPPTLKPKGIVGTYEREGVEVAFERAIYAGHLFTAWGHLLTEAISTAWAAPELPDIPVVFTPWARLSLTRLTWAFELLRLAGWGDREIVVVSSDAAIGTAHVPDRLIRLDDIMYGGSRIDPALNTVYDRMAGGCGPAQSDPVFFARTENHRREHPEETDIANELASNGVRIVEGWTLGVREQIAIAANAPALIGFSGSNLHTSVFAGAIPVIEIQDRRALSHNRRGFRNLQDPLCALRGQTHIRVPAFDTPGGYRTASSIVADVVAAL